MSINSAMLGTAAVKGTVLDLIFHNPWSITIFFLAFLLAKQKSYKESKWKLLCPFSASLTLHGKFLLDLMEVLLIERLLCPEGRFLTRCANLSSCTVHSFRRFWKWVGGLWGFWVALISPSSPRPLLGLVAVFRWYCIVLISGSCNKDVCPEEALL